MMHGAARAMRVVSGRRMGAGHVGRLCFRRWWRRGLRHHQFRLCSSGQEIWPYGNGPFSWASPNTIVFWVATMYGAAEVTWNIAWS